MNVTLKHRAEAIKRKLFSDIIEVPKALQQSHFPGLDGLRGISILFVVFGHFAMYRGMFDYLNGEIGVEIFFVISGFLITTLLLKEKVKHGTVSFKNFYIRRFLRIVPVSFLFLFLMIFINKPLQLGITNKSFSTAFLYLKNIPFRNSSEWFTGHYWSLSIEEQFYLFFPFFIVYQTNKFIIFSVILMISLPFLNICGFHNVGVFYTNHVIHFLTFSVIILLGKGSASILVGSLYSILLFKRVININKLNKSYFLSFILLVFSCYLLTRASYFYVEFVSIVFFPFIIGYVIILNLQKKNFLRLFLDNPILQKIGVLSYSIYIWQQLFTSNRTWHLFKFSDTFIVRLILLFLVAYISYNFYEKMFLKFKMRFKRIE